MNWLVSGLPSFNVKAENVHVIKTPSEFYKTLISKSETAKNRIFLSSLYLGDGALEEQLVCSIEKNLKSNSDLSCTILLDFLRGTRGSSLNKSSTTLLQSIAGRAQISLYHTPRLSGFIKKLLPERTNEIIGLQHMKLYIFDNTLIISGANLSDSYFTNRQDRYIMFENCKEIADFFTSIIHEVSRCSFVMNGDNVINLHPECYVHPFKGVTSDYCSMIKDRIDGAISKLNEQNKEKTDGDTIVYPILQMGLLGINQEFLMLKRLFEQKDPTFHITLVSGYFNCIDEYIKMIFEEGKYKLDVLTAAPNANGFFGAAGLSKYIPSMYSKIAGDFITRAETSGRKDKITFHEYSRPGWTFHAKGIWMQKGEELATVLGSSNYGYRSVHRDLEAQILLVTRNDGLKKRLSEERSLLFDYSSVVDHMALRGTDHHVPLLVNILSRAFRNFF